MIKFEWWVAIFFPITLTLTKKMVLLDLGIVVREYELYNAGDVFCVVFLTAAST